MTTYDQTPESILRAKIAQTRERAQAIADTRLRMLAPNGDPRELSQADHDDVLRAALRFIVETERDGSLALTRANGLDAAAAQFRMRCQVDDELGEEPDIRKHLKQALRAYQRFLEIAGGIADWDRK